jgi:PAS domain S-box-containing protein
MKKENRTKGKHANANISRYNPGPKSFSELEQLYKGEGWYSTLINHAPDGIFIVDVATGQFLDCNQQGLDMFGYTREKMLSFTPVDFSPPVAPDGRPVQEALRERLESLIPGKQITFEWVHLHADGYEIPCEIRAVLLPSPNRRVLRASIIDITQRKLAEEDIENRLRFQELVATISTKFIGLSGAEFEQAIQDTLAEVGRYFNLDTVRLYRLSLQGDVLKIRNQWHNEQLSPPGEMAEINKMKYPNLAAHYSKGEATVFSKFDDSPDWPEMRKILKFFGTKAGVGVPLEIDSTGVDIFAMDKVRSEHVWPKDIVEQSKAIGKVILSAIRRREAEVKLQDSYDEIKKLKDRFEQENIYLQQEIKLEHQYGEIIGQSNALIKVLSIAEKVARTDSTVLITGETGVGKELMARAIHDLSNRKERAMLKVNCAALPSTLIESELFGREKGAYTGALTKQIGRFEVADNSTIFLDEISELSQELQAKLLRVLQEGQFERLGSPKTIQVDVRVLAATNQDLEKAVQEGNFRKDLYYRLNVFPIEVPPLRQRKEDIPLLVWTFVKEFSKKMGKRIESIPREAMEALQNYSWPGNVRELRNVIERAMILTKGTKLNIEMPKVSDANISRNKSLEDVERGHIVEVLEAANWRIRGKNGAAEILGLKPTTLEAKMHKLGVRRK